MAASNVPAALPEPAKQHEPWQLPSGTVIPEYVVKVTAILFDAGLADPRSGVYREVEIVNRHNGNDTVQTHAWVFPGEYAVAWNGLVYRIRAVGAPADIEQDVGAILADRPWSGRMPFPFRREPEPAKAVFWSSMQANQTIMPASIALLLRLGRTDLAEQLWQAPEAPDLFGNARQREAEEGLWLATAASAWFGTAYMRLVNAFDAEDDQEAADVAESILQWRSRVPSSWRVRNAWVPKRIPDISFLEPVADLLSDSQRRLREPKRESVDLKAVNQGSGSVESLRSPPADRIADLIDRLEDVRGAKITVPGTLLYSFDPVYKLLKEEGEEAVEILLNAYENDHRLTRTFDYARPWYIEYTPIPVHHVVEILLGDILGDRARIGNSSPAELRAWWRQRKSSNRADRSFELLADDQASPEQWLEGADFLTTRSDVEWVEGGKTGAAGACDVQKAAPEVNGKGLSTRRNPTVSELIAKRTASLVASGSDLACSMAVKAALWDSKTALPVLQEAVTLKSCRANDLFAIARLSLGIPGAAAEWVMALDERPSFPPLRIDELSPLWMFPSDPVLQQTAERLFARPDSPWSPGSKFADVNSPLLAIPIFRRAVFLALEDSKVAGKAGRTAEGLLTFSTADGGGGGLAPSHDPRDAPAGAERPLRVMDLVAWELSSLDGAPEFGLDWQEADKDAAISAIAEFLRAHENQVRAFPMQLQDTNCPGQRVYLSH